MAARSAGPRSSMLLLALLLALALGAGARIPGAATAAPAATNPVALTGGVVAEVSAAGLQQVSGAALLAAGLALDGLDPQRLRLFHSGGEVALELRGLHDGRFDPADELRFYAPAPGDRWNATERYWLDTGGEGGLRMAARALGPAGPGAATAAIERGDAGRPAHYDPRYAGADGDHWFAAELRAGPGLPDAGYELGLAPTLRPAAGPLTLRLQLVAVTGGPHRLDVSAAGQTQSLRWSGAGPRAHELRFEQAATAIGLSLISGAAPDIVLLDGVSWALPVVLELDGRGGSFEASGGSYRLAGLAPGQELYDISTPAQPAQLQGLGADGGFTDAAPAATYLATGLATLHSPALSLAAPGALPSAADALYIAPAELLPALAPLVEHRRRAGLMVEAVDVQAIYDRWSYGQVRPEAIRAFLRFARESWQRAPQTVALVGDGTSDPLNYSGRDNRTLIPPYLAVVDPWLGETACETCFVQLDGADPLHDLLPDMAIGRLPVKGAAELAGLVRKIIAYETAPGGVGWRSRQLFLADNSFQADGSPDSAGDFAAYAEEGIALQPPGVEVERVFYDPRPGAPASHEPDARRAHERALAALQRGAGVVVYTGHSHQWQWADTDPAASDRGLLGLYDVDTLTNGERLPIVLALTCLSSAFQTPAYSGTTIDERLVLHPDGGAIAVWGPTGLGVAYGHALLQQGFFEALWAAPPQSATLGQLTLAGYQKLAAGGCCQESIRTYALLGDPLTPARVLAPQRMLLPLIAR